VKIAGAADTFIILLFTWTVLALAAAQVSIQVEFSAGTGYFL
jgi:hypothetical protein